MNKRPSIKNKRDDFRNIGGNILEEHEGQRIDSYLAEFFPFKSRSGWRKLLQNRNVLINNEFKAKPSYKLKKGDSISYFYPQEREPKVNFNLKVLYNEQNIMAVSKSSGLPMHEGGKYRINTFANIVKTSIGPEWAAIHRLDLETSGIVLCGATPEIRRFLTNELLNHNIKKEYLAIVRGIPTKKSWLTDAPLGNLQSSKIRIKRWVIPQGGLPSKTEFKVIDSKSSGYSLLSACPLTGRTNQIRIHSAYEGFPLVGDKLYCDDENIFIEFAEKGMTKNIIDKTGHNRLCLHAHKISFFHPILNMNINVISELPDDLVKLWDNL